MELKKINQFGTFTVILLSLFLIFSIVMGLTVGLTDNLVLTIYIVLSLILFISLLLFYRIVIEIDTTNISFKLGIGIIRRSYNLSEIESCTPVKDSFLNGWGIHKIRNGWLYNVSGFKAIELTFKNTDKVVRIGTNRPDEIAGVVTGLLNVTGDKDREYSSPQNSGSKTRNTIIAVVVTLIIVAFFNLYQYQPAKIDLQENQFKILGEYGFSENYHDIVAIDTISRMPGIEARTNGFALGKVCKGNFRLTNIGRAILFINFNVSPFVQLVMRNRPVVFFNLKDRESTIEAFEKIKSKSTLNPIKSNKTQPSR